VLGFEHGPIRAFSEVLYTAPLHPSPEEAMDDPSNQRRGAQRPRRVVFFSSRVKIIL